MSHLRKTNARRDRIRNGKDLKCLPLKETTENSYYRQPQHIQNVKNERHHKKYDGQQNKEEDLMQLFFVCFLTYAAFSAHYMNVTAICPTHKDTTKQLTKELKCN